MKLINYRSLKKRYNFQGAKMAIENDANYKEEQASWPFFVFEEKLFEHLICLSLLITIKGQYSSANNAASLII